jgi:hypothetical protein
MLAVFHAGEGAVGLAEEISFPPWSTATHSELSGHDAAGTITDLLVLFHADAPLVGFVDTDTNPLPVATHNVADVQESASSPSDENGAFARFQCAEPPVGSVEYTTRSKVSAARQKEAVGQVTSDSPAGPSTFATTQAAAPPDGLVDVSTFP